MDNVRGKGDFVEITDPQTGRTFFANILTGECSWEKPSNAKITPKDPSGQEWWELFDDNHKLPYYYNTKTGETEWIRPSEGTIIPLIAIQNSSIGKRMSVMVQRQSMLGGDNGAAGGQYGQSGHGNAYGEPAPAHQERSQPSNSSNAAARYGEPASHQQRAQTASHSNNYYPERPDAPSHSDYTHRSPPNSKPSSQPQSRNPSNPDISHHPDISHQKHNMTSHAGNAEYSHADPSAYGASPPRGVLSKSTPELSGRPSYADGRPSQSGRAYGEQRDPRGEEARPSQSGYSDPRLEGRPSQGGYGDQRGMEQRPSRAGGGAAGGGAYGDHYGDQLDRRPSRAGAGPYSDQQGRIHGGYSTPDVSSRYPDDGRSRPAGNPSDAFHQPGGKRPLVQAAEAAAKAREQGISAPVVNVDAAASMSPLSAQNRITSTAQSPTNWQTTPSGGGRVLPMDLKQQLTQFQLDGFAKKYFAEHRRGIFRRRVPVEKMMVYQKDSLKTPLMVLNKTMHRDALKCFKSIQKIMSSKPQNCVADVQQLLDKGIVHGELRDEIYVGICKQLTRNPNGDSVFRGWLLLCVVSIAFPPSKNFEDYLKSFVQQHMNEHENQVDVLAKHCMKKLLRICKTGPRGKTPTAQEIERAQEAPFSQNLFGETLEDIMKMELEINPNAEMPRIMKFLADAILHLNGARTEGIFRVPGDADMVTDLRCRIEKGVYDYSGITDPNVPSSLLKLWLRDLADPLIPTDYYMSCIKVGQRENEASLNELGPAAYALVDTLPEYNRRVVYYMIQFLRVMADPTNQTYTKMTIGNIAMVWAPNFLRCPSDNPTTIFENTKFEQAFLRVLIQYESS